MGILRKKDVSEEHHCIRCKNLLKGRDYVTILAAGQVIKAPVHLYDFESTGEFHYTINVEGKTIALCRIKDEADPKDRHKWQIISAWDREVAIKRMEASMEASDDKWLDGILLRKCAYCGKPSKYLITELGIKFECHPRVWGWCGECQIGG